MSEVAALKNVKFIRRCTWLVVLFFIFQLIAFVLLLLHLAVKKSKERDSAEFESIKNAVNSLVMYENGR